MSAVLLRGTRGTRGLRPGRERVPPTGGLGSGADEPRTLGVTGV